MEITPLGDSALLIRVAEDFDDAPEDALNKVLAAKRGLKAAQIPGTIEIAPAYTEQNDPIQQRERLEHQAGGEQQKLDEDFLVALEHGMPPAGGMGMGIDRLCMMLLGQENIRDVILFPQLKPKA